jgi:hypothetical protein
MIARGGKEHTHTHNRDFHTKSYHILHTGPESNSMISSRFRIYGILSALPVIVTVCITNVWK